MLFGSLEALFRVRFVYDRVFFSGCAMLFVEFDHRNSFELLLLILKLTELFYPLFITMIMHDVPGVRINCHAESVFADFSEVLAPVVLLVDHMMRRSQL